VHLDAAEHGDHVVFLHAVRDGPASQSYGLQVARLAGVPRAVIERARSRLRQLEQGAVRQAEAVSPQLPLFGAVVEAPPVLEALRALEPDALTPREALEALYRLKGMLGE
jgi:DNA mismatch repair protein MutS